MTGAVQSDPIPTPRGRTGRSSRTTGAHCPARFDVDHVDYVPGSGNVVTRTQAPPSSRSYSVPTRRFSAASGAHAAARPTAATRTPRISTRPPTDAAARRSKSAGSALARAPPSRGRYGGIASTAKAGSSDRRGPPAPSGGTPRTARGGSSPRRAPPGAPVTPDTVSPDSRRVQHLRGQLSVILGELCSMDSTQQGLHGWEVALLESHRQVRQLQTLVDTLQQPQAVPAPAPVPAEAPHARGCAYEQTASAAVAAGHKTTGVDLRHHPQPEVEIVRLEAELASALKEREAFREQAASLSAMIVDLRKTDSATAVAVAQSGAANGAGHAGAGGGGVSAATARDSLRRIELEARCATLDRAVRELQFERAQLLTPNAVQMLLLRYNVDDTLRQLLMADINAIISARTEDFYADAASQSPQRSTMSPARAPDASAPRSLQPGPGLNPSTASTYPSLSEMTELDRMYSAAHQHRQQQQHRAAKHPAASTSGSANHLQVHDTVTFGDVSFVSTTYTPSPLKDSKARSAFHTGNSPYGVLKTGFGSASGGHGNVNGNEETLSPLNATAVMSTGTLDSLR